jgi:hypothetical protein
LLKCLHWITTQKLLLHETMCSLIAPYKSFYWYSICLHNENNHCHHYIIMLMKCKLLHCHKYNNNMLNRHEKHKSYKILVSIFVHGAMLLGFNLIKKANLRRRMISRKKIETIWGVEVLVLAFWPQWFYTWTHWPQKNNILLLS